MFEWIKRLTGLNPATNESPPEPQPARPPRKPEARKPAAPKAESPSKTAKELATEKGEPWVSITNFDLDATTLHQGAFELDWNEIFIARLVKAGYMLKKDDTDADIVDRWFQNVCRHVVLETWEQEQAIANSGMYVTRKNIGDGFSEVS
jgi:hypothetical protein